MIRRERRATHRRFAITAVVLAVGAAQPFGSAQAAGTAGEPQAKVAFKLADSRITASRDLATSLLHKDVLWTFNTNDPARRLFAVGLDGRTIASYTVTGAGHWNSLALAKGSAGRSTLLLGDFGDFGGSRKRGVAVYEVREPARLGGSGGRLRATQYRLVYPDGAHDADAFFVDPNDARPYVVTKTPRSSVVYALPSVLGPGMQNRLTRVRTLHFVVEGGAYAPDGRVVLRGRRTARVLAGIRGGVIGTVQLPRQAPAESIAVNGGAMLVGGQGRHGTVWSVPLPTASVGAPSHGTGSQSRPIADDGGGVPGGLVGIASLAGLVLVAALGGALYLRGRRR